MAASPLALRKGAYFTFDCTSYAVPHVVGALALLKEASPGATASVLKQAIMAGCEPAKQSLLSRAVGQSSFRERVAAKLHIGLTTQADPRWSVGAGRVNAYRAYEWLKKNESASLS